MAHKRWTRQCPHPAVSTPGWRPPPSLALTPRKPVEGSVPHNSAGPPGRSCLWPCLPQGQYPLSWSSQGSPVLWPEGAQGHGSPGILGSNQALKIPNVLIGNPRPRLLCSLTGCRGDSKDHTGKTLLVRCLPLRTAGRSWIPGWVLPSLWPGRGDRQFLVSFWVQQETLGWSFTITVSLPPALSHWENLASPYPESKTGGHGAQRSPPSGTSSYSLCHPRTRDSQCSMKDTAPSCHPKQKLLSKWQSVNIGTGGSSTPGSTLSQMHVAVAWQPPRLHHPSPRAHAVWSCLCSAPPAPPA